MLPRLRPRPQLSSFSQSYLNPFTASGGGVFFFPNAAFEVREIVTVELQVSNSEVSVAFAFEDLLFRREKNPTLNGALLLI